MTTDQRAKELREALEAFPPNPFKGQKFATVLDAAMERLAQLEGQALVIEKVNGEWPEWAVKAMQHIAGDVGSLAAEFDLDDFAAVVPLPDRTL